MMLTLLAPVVLFPWLRDWTNRKPAATPRGVQTPHTPAREANWHAPRTVGAIPAESRCTSVRVLRVAEPGARRHSAGRMVISGRMVDVCRELERMAHDEQRS